MVIGVGSAIIVVAALLTSSTLPLRGLLANVVSVLGAIGLFVSTALAASIHSSYPERHDSPGDFSQLLVKGPYELCRHPMYFFTVIAQLSIPITLLSLWGILVAVAITPLWINLIKLEERELVEYWGQVYLDYMRRTPMLIPRLKKLRVRGE